MICKIEYTNFRGEGVGRAANGKRYRIANALKGESVRAVDLSLPRRSMALLYELLSPSSEREKAECPNWVFCGACQYQCLSLQRQAEIKFENWTRLLAKFLDIPSDCEKEYHQASCQTAYRHRCEGKFYDGRLAMAVRRDIAAYHAEVERHDEGCEADTGFETVHRALKLLDVRIGKDMPKSIPLVDCPHHAKELRRLIAIAQAKLDQLTPIDSRLSFAFDAFETDSRITLFAQAGAEEQGRTLAQTLANDLAVKVICQTLPPKGSHVYPKPIVYGQSPYYYYAKDLYGAPLSALSGAWIPVNPQNAAIIAKCLEKNLKDFASHSQKVLEVGCGCGTHASLFPAHMAYHGIDASWPAIRSAIDSAVKNAWKNKSFQNSKAKHYFEKNYYKGCRADLIILHSNRLPYGDEISYWCKKFGAKQVFIVAPSAYALAKECQSLKREGYGLKRLSFCDTMPRTYHMIAVAALELSG